MDCTDRISELPEAILHHILSYLPAKDVVRTCVLSKTWQAVHARNPCLVFKYYHFHPRNKYVWGQRGQQRKLLFMNYVESRIQQFLEQETTTLLKKFHLFIYRVYDYKVDDSRIESWLKRVMTRGVRCLYVALPRRSPDSMGYYPLPQFVFHSDILTELTLVGCDLDAARGNNIELPKLQRLEVCCPDVDEDIIKHLMSACPLLETLHLSSCIKLTNLQVTALPCLKEVILLYNCNLGNVEVEAPNLEQLTYEVSKKRRRPCNFTLSPSDNNLKLLKLANVDVNRGWLQQQVSRCEDLHITGVYEDEDIKISSQKLRRLRIQDCSGMTTMVEIDCQNLDSLYYCKNSMPFHISENNFKLRNFIFQFYLSGDQQTLWLDKLIEIWGNFNFGKELIKVAFSCKGHKDVIIVDGCLEIMLPVLHGLKDCMPAPILVQVSTIARPTDVDNFVNCLLYFNRKFAYERPTPPYKFLYVTSIYGNNSFSKDLYEKLSKAKVEALCCEEGLFITKCWRHHLHNVKNVTSKRNRIPAALTPYQSKPYQITKILLEWRDV